MRLNTIYSNHINKNRKRVGRGIGSGTGKTCGAGHKGQRARTGVAIKGFEGGQMPLTRRLPKRGFVNRNKVYFKSINLAQIENLVNTGKLDSSSITKEHLMNIGLVSSLKKPVKLLAKGTLSKKITIAVDSVSKAAKNAIEGLGGTVIVDYIADNLSL